MHFIARHCIILYFIAFYGMVLFYTVKQHSLNGLPSVNMQIQIKSSRENLLQKVADTLIRSPYMKTGKHPPICRVDQIV